MRPSFSRCLLQSWPSPPPLSFNAFPLLFSFLFCASTLDKFMGVLAQFCCNSFLCRLLATAVVVATPPPPSLAWSVVVYVHVCPPHMQTRLCMRRPLCRLIASPFAAAAHSFKDRKCFSVVFTWHKVVVMRQKASSQTARQTEGRTDCGVCAVWTAADPSHVLHAFWCLTVSLMCGCSIYMYVYVFLSTAPTCM